MLPIEAQIYYKRELPDPQGQLTAYYTKLYTAYLQQQPNVSPLLYETVLLSPNASNAIDLAQTVDRSLWIALLVRASDMPKNGGGDEIRHVFTLVRQAIGGRTLSLGIVPFLTDEAASRHLTPDGRANPPALSLLQYQVPAVPKGGSLPENQQDRVPNYRLDAMFSRNVLVEPGVVELILPVEGEIILWDNLSPLEAGARDFPPALQDTDVEERVITWLRITAAASTQAKLLWAGINATMIAQRASVYNELLLVRNWRTRSSCDALPNTCHSRIGSSDCHSWRNGYTGGMEES